MKRLFLVLISLFLLAFLLPAGDIASFVNLGFSPDGRYFMFSQHGYTAENSSLYAEIFTVDVQKNLFVPGGINKGEYNAVIQPGQSSLGAVFTLYENVFPFKNRYGISHLEEGRPVYIRIETGTEEDDSLDFRDFSTGDHYQINLIKEISNETGATSSTFHINLSVTSSKGFKQDLVIGHPEFIRQNITDYKIDRILIAPNRKSLIFIIRMSDTELNIRFMVEAVTLR